MTSDRIPFITRHMVTIAIGHSKWNLHWQFPKVANRTIHNGIESDALSGFALMATNTSIWLSLPVITKTYVLAATIRMYVRKETK